VSSNPDPADLHQRILDGDQTAEAALASELRRLFEPHIRDHRLHNDLDDVLSDSYLELQRAIRERRINDPMALWGYAAVIVRRRCERLKEQNRRVVSIDTGRRTFRMQNLAVAA
jgi:hypothetical protein